MFLEGTGSAGMETAFVNLVEKGDPVLVLVNGVFGKRMVAVASRRGAQVEELEFEWGTPVIPDVAKKENYLKKMVPGRSEYSGHPIPQDFFARQKSVRLP
jgi:alanine-glyoxylate transaminase/serine-glyoxylate transaminase/serine-pyruvate transaminase